MDDVTVVEYRRRRSGHCGYCGGYSCKLSYGMPTHMMSCLDYQTLLDRGWRRSGKYCYKPAMRVTCCPLYTIRCKVLDFKLTKSKKKVLNKMKQFLLSEGSEEVEKWRGKVSSNVARKNDAMSFACNYEMNSLAPYHNADGTLLSCAAVPGSSNFEPTRLELKREIKKGLGPDPSKPPCKKAKLLRSQRRKQKFAHQSPMGDSPAVFNQTDCIKSLGSQIPHLNPDSAFKRKLEVRMMRAKQGDEEFEASRKESHSVYQKYQQAIHGDHPLECDENQWLRFLVNTSLHRDSDGPGPGYGSYHQQYVLDGKIIAVGVIDILPNCVSSVYLYYDPDYGFLSLGTYSALSEIAYTQSLHQESDALKNYYIGFYIHSCQKMRYKGEFLPSDLLCPETYEWVPIELCKPTLDQKKYSRLNILNNGSEDAVDPHKGDSFDINDLGILFRGSLMKYALYRSLKYFALQHEGNGDASEEEKQLAIAQKRKVDLELRELKEYISLVGDVCAKRMFLCREDY